MSHAPSNDRPDRARHEPRLAIANARTKAAIMAALDAADIAAVTVGFDGHDGCGGVDDLQIDGPPCVLPDVPVNVCCVDWNGAVTAHATVSLREAVEDFVLSFLARTHRDWEIGVGAYGEVEFDVPTDTVTLDFNERIVASENHRHRL